MQFPIDDYEIDATKRKTMMIETVLCVSIVRISRAERVKVKQKRKRKELQKKSSVFFFN